MRFRIKKGGIRGKKDTKCNFMYPGLLQRFLADSAEFHETFSR